MSGFTEIADRYEKDSLVQRSASDRLFELLQIQETESVLDLGCGPGHLAKRIRELTEGTVIGLDASEGMIQEARRNYAHLDIAFESCRADHIPYHDLFDVIFCNSTFQWFKNAPEVLKACHQSLRPKGRMGIQAPARKNYCPNFIEAVERVKKDPWLKDRFAAFKTPWLFLDTAEEYRNLFEDGGYEVLYSCLDQVESLHRPEEVFKIFDSGAAAGYLNQEFYSTSLSDDYRDAFREKIREAFQDQTDSEGMVRLTFFRIYLVARKPGSQILFGSEKK